MRISTLQFWGLLIVYLQLLRLLSLLHSERAGRGCRGWWTRVLFIKPRSIAITILISSHRGLAVWVCVPVKGREREGREKGRIFRPLFPWDNICNYTHTNTHIRYSCVNFQCSTALHSGDEWKAEVFLLNQLSLGWLNKSSWEGFRLISRLCWSRGLTKTNRLYSRQRMFIPFRLLLIMLLCVSRFSWHLLSLLLQVSWKHPRFCEHEWWLWNIPVFTTVIMYPAAKHEQIALNTPHRF